MRARHAGIFNLQRPRRKKPSICSATCIKSLQIETIDFIEEKLNLLNMRNSHGMSFRLMQGGKEAT